MNTYDDPNLSPQILQTYQGYSLQVFTSGRIKMSFHVSHTHRVEYYGECPKRFHEAYARQAQRSHHVMPKHFACVDAMLEGSPYSRIHRVHLKADNNATADNAHIITDIDQDLCHVVLGSLHHQWELPKSVIQAGNALIPSDDDVVRHKCHNRRCINPAHLTHGTQLENINDTREK